MNLRVPLRLEHCYLVATPSFTRIQTGLAGRAGATYFRALFPDLWAAVSHPALDAIAFNLQNYPVWTGGPARFMVVSHYESAERNLQRAGHPHTVSLTFDQVKLALAECEERVGNGELLKLPGLDEFKQGDGRTGQ